MSRRHKIAIIIAWIVVLVLIAEAVRQLLIMSGV